MNDSISIISVHPPDFTESADLALTFLGLLLCLLRMRFPPVLVCAWEETYSTQDDSSKQLHQIYDQTLATFHSYSLSPSKLHSMLSAPSAKVFVASIYSEIVGFAVTYTIRAGAYSDPSAQHLHGGLALLLVSPHHREQGVGSALHNAAISYLEQAIRMSLHDSTPARKQGLILLGSWFPRFFPGLPDGPEFDEAEEWLATRGWKFKVEESLPIDLYRLWRDGPELRREMHGLMELGKRNGHSFGPLRRGEEAALAQLQRRNFYRITGWPDLFTDMIAAGCSDNIHCAYNANGELIGATIAAVHNKGERTNPAHHALAFPDMIGESCGIIACVGIDGSVRGGGAGTGMLASAILNMAQRGADGCFIDWTGVEVRAFYERLGFKQWMRAYREASRWVSEDSELMLKECAGLTRHAASRRYHRRPLRLRERGRDTSVGPINTGWPSMMRLRGRWLRKAANQF